ncbi:cupin domain-containing protein [Leucobacter sp. GX24907]
MSQTISLVRGAEAEQGSRGELDLVSCDSYSLHFWQLRDFKGDVHSNNYDLALYVTAGTLSVFDADGNENLVHAGDSIIIPAGTSYSMAAESFDAVETRNPKN